MHNTKSHYCITTCRAGWLAVPMAQEMKSVQTNVPGHSYDHLNWAFVWSPQLGFPSIIQNHFHQSLNGSQLISIVTQSWDNWCEFDIQSKLFLSKFRSHLRIHWEIHRKPFTICIVVGSNTINKMIWWFFFPYLKDVVNLFFFFNF